MAADDKPGTLPKEVDLLVIGGGLAGYAAALEAANAGADVLLIDKEPKNGGATVLSGGSFSFAGTPLQKSLGIEDTPELLYEDLRRVGNYANVDALVRTYAENALPAYEWLAAQGARFERVFIASGQSVPRAHSRNAREVLDIVVDRAHETGRVKTRLNTKALRLIRPEASGPVVGARVEMAGQTHNIAARRGVVLATGCFQRNEDLLTLFAPRHSGAQRMGSPGNTGDGLKMAWQLGADMRDLGHIKGTFGSHIGAGSEDHFLLLPIYAGAIAVNKEARRFVDESLSYKLIGDACLRQTDCIGYQIFDQRIFDRGRPGIPSMDFQHDLDVGRLVRADTLEELAGIFGLDPSTLVRTVNEYNAHAREQRDPEFGRDGLCNHYGELVTIDRPPFYGFASTTVVIATYCGVAINARAQVQDVYGAAIPRLFAAGGVTGGFHGEAYMTGTANGKAVIFGRIAAQSALA